MMICKMKLQTEVLCRKGIMILVIQNFLKVESYLPQKTKFDLIQLIKDLSNFRLIRS